MFKRIFKLIRNPYVFSMITQIIGFVIAFLFTVFQARFLGADIKGQIATITSMTGITSIIFGFGISQAYPYYRKNSKKNVLPIFIRISLVMLIAYFIIALLTVLVMELDKKYISVIIITPLMVYEFIISEITLVEKPNKRNGINTIVNCAELIMVIALWLFVKPTFLYGIMIVIFQHVVKTLVFTFWWRKTIFQKTDITMTELKSIMKFGLFPMLSMLMATLNYRVDVLMLDHYVSDATIGIYSIGVLLADRMWLVPDALKGVMVSNITKGKDSSEVSYVLRICNTLCLVIVLGVILIGKQFINFVFGAEYDGAYNITLILLMGVFPMISYKVITAYNTVIGKQNVSFVILSLSVILNIASNYFLIPKYGIYGAGIASVVSYLICSVLFIVYFCKITNEKYSNMLLINKNDISKLRSMLHKK